MPQWGATHFSCSRSDTFGGAGGGGGGGDDDDDDWPREEFGAQKKQEGLCF